MSRSVDLFIDCDRPIEQMAAEVVRLTRLELKPSAQGTWVLDEEGVHADLRANPFVDDGQLPLRQYRYTLSARIGGGTRPAEAPETAMLRLVAEALRQGGISNLLVHDLQYRESSRAAVAPESAGYPTAAGSESAVLPDEAVVAAESAARSTGPLHEHAVTEVGPP